MHYYIMHHFHPLCVLILNPCDLGKNPNQVDEEEIMPNTLERFSRPKTYQDKRD